MIIIWSTKSEIIFIKSKLQLSNAQNRSDSWRK